MALLTTKRHPVCGPPVQHPVSSPLCRTSRQDSKSFPLLPPHQQALKHAGQPVCEGHEPPLEAQASYSGESAGVANAIEASPTGAIELTIPPTTSPPSSQRLSGVDSSADNICVRSCTTTSVITRVRVLSIAAELGQS